MLSNYMHKFSSWVARVKFSFGTDISTPADRRAARIWCHVFDQSFTRLVWSNFTQIAPGVYRAGQPAHAALVHYRKFNVRTVINLREPAQHAPYLFEKESCQILGLTLLDRALFADRATPAVQILEILQTLRQMKNPVVFHCKFGTDRTGFIAAAYLMVFEAVPVEYAKGQISTSYFDLAFAKRNVYRYILNVYQARNAQAAIGFEDWIKTEYDDEKIQAGFDCKRPARELI